MGRLTLVLIADVPAAGLTDFQAYEDRVLPLLARHDGRLERRLRSADRLTEVHVVSFGSDSDLAAFRADPERAAHQELLTCSGVTQRVIPVQDQ